MLSLLKVVISIRRFTDTLGVIVEKLLVIPLSVLYFITFTANEAWRWFFGCRISEELYLFLLEMYSKLIENNVGNITTIAAVFIGIYVTVLSVLGSIKVNTMISFFDAKDLKKLVKFIGSALVAALLVLFYSLIMLAISDVFFRAFFIFLTLIYMLFSALRFSLVIYAIYSHDLKKISTNLEMEKKERDDYQHIMYKLNKFLNEHEHDALARRADKMTQLLKKDKESK